MTNRILSVLALSLFLTSIGLYSASNRVVGLDKDLPIKAPQPVELGMVEQGHKIPFRFRVKNTGSHSIVVTETTRSCGCTELDDVKGRCVVAGAVLEFGGQLDTESKRGPMFSHVILSYQGRPGTPKRDLVLTVKATVRGHLELCPESIEVPAGATEKIVRDVELESRVVDSFEIERLAPSAPWISAEILHPNHIHRAGMIVPARIRIVIDPAAMPREHYSWALSSQSVEIRTSAAEEPSLELPINFVGSKSRDSR